jgi:predicted phosphodiesterase
MGHWGLVSDIHGNLGALRAAAAYCDDAGVDAYVCLGDVIGRGDPERCVEWVRDHARIAIVGNRDLDYLTRVPAPLQEVVRSWGHEAVASDFVVTHGDPKLHRVLNSAAEKNGFAAVPAYLDERHARVWFFGHTHRARIWEIVDGFPRQVGKARVELSPSAHYVVNVGTTGLPLPGRGGASFVVYDDEQHVLEIVPLDGKRGAGKPQSHDAAVAGARAIVNGG